MPLAPEQVLDAALEKNAAWHESLAAEWLCGLIAQRSTLGLETGAVAEAARILAKFILACCGGRAK